MDNQTLYIVLGVAGAAALLTGAASFFYYKWQLARLSRMMEQYQERMSSGSVRNASWNAPEQTDGSAAPESGSPQNARKEMHESLADTRESKLEAQLRRLLFRSALQQKRAKKDRENLAGLLSDLSHQLKTPLANVVMDAELLQEDGLSQEEQQRFSHHIAEQAEKMQWLLSALIKSSRLESGILQFEPKPQSIRRTLAQSVSAVYVQAQAKNISILLDEFDDAALYHNRKWTAEAITNILENAIKYSPAGSAIRIDVEPLEIYTKLNIRDEGPGVKPEEYGKIFQRFYRGSESAEVEGTGLGLYLAQTILVQEKGYAAVSANPEGGSCFSVFLLNRAPHR